MTHGKPLQLTKMCKTLFYAIICLIVVILGFIGRAAYICLIGLPEVQYSAGLKRAYIGVFIQIIILFIQKREN